MGRGPGPAVGAVTGLTRARLIREATGLLLDAVAELLPDLPEEDLGTVAALDCYAETAAESLGLDPGERVTSAIGRAARSALALASGVPPRLAPLLTGEQLAAHIDHRDLAARRAWLKRAASNPLFTAPPARR